MERAQLRDAARSEKFYFRKDVYVGRSEASSVASSSGSSSPTGDAPPKPKKEKKMRNCFPPLPLPEDGVPLTRPVEDEYEEMSMDEIINGKVSPFFFPEYGV